jgi:hypothetical protein
MDSCPLTGTYRLLYIVAWVSNAPKSVVFASGNSLLPGNSTLEKKDKED